MNKNENFDELTFKTILNEIVSQYKSISEFAQVSEIDRTYISKYMNTSIDTPPSANILRKIANNSNGIVNYLHLMKICGYLNEEEIENIVTYKNKNPYDKIEGIIMNKVYELENENTQLRNELALAKAKLEVYERLVNISGTKSQLGFGPPIIKD